MRPWLLALPVLGAALVLVNGPSAASSAPPPQLGKTEHAQWWQGRFFIGQTKGKKPVGTQSLSGPLACSKRSLASSAGAKRSLWGKGKGRFRTKGKNASATVRGTIWLTQDTCAGTLVRVKRGVVDVLDFKRHKHVRVKAGHSYFAKR